MTESPKSEEQLILIAHGGGGEMTRRLVAEHVLPRLGNPLLAPLTDAAEIKLGDVDLCFTTDALVVQPLEFPGGDIGRLAVSGTVNDLAVMGAEPKVLSLALVIEEGLRHEVMDRIVDSIARTAEEAGVVIATGDTKVVERQRGDGLVITTAGVGVKVHPVDLGMGRIEPGDRVVITGGIAEHGLAVMSAREGLSFETVLRSDVAPLADLAGAICDLGGGVKFLRDPTRGGLSGVLADIVEETGFSVDLEEAKVPLKPSARHAAEMLGLDPLGVANEGKIVVVVSPDTVDRVLAVCRANAKGKDAAVVGTVTPSAPPLVELVTTSGGRRIVQRPYGEELPRIC